MANYLADRLTAIFNDLQTMPIDDLAWQHERCRTLIDGQRGGSIDRPGQTMPMAQLGMLCLLQDQIYQTERTRRRGAAIAKGEHVG